MAEVAKKFIERAPRYTLRAKDNKSLKFAFEGDRTHIYSTSLVNISLTGLAFVTLAENAPELDAIIKLEIPVPGSQQIAWWGRVVRIESYRVPKPWQNKNLHATEIKEKLIAVRFEQLPENIKTEIHQGLSLKAKQLARQKYFQFQFQGEWVRFVKTYWQQFLIFALCILVTFSLLYLLSQPFGNYDTERGAPWGQRFK